MKALCVVAFLVACGGSNSNDEACFEGQIEAGGGTQACFDCIKASCSSQLSAVESACASFFSCVCPSGVFVGSDEEACGSDVGSDCATAGVEGDKCQTTTCASSCGSGD